MPLFGPNIKKMKEKGDIDGLAGLLKADNLQLRVDATEALLDLGDTKGLQLIEQRYSDVFKWGDKFDKVELMVMMQGRYVFDTILAWVPLDSPEDRDRALGIMKLEKVTFRRKPHLELVRPILFKAAANSSEDPLIRLFALTTLAELGDKSNEVMHLMIELLLGTGGLNIWNVNETIRALSRFSDSNEVAALLIKIQRGDLFQEEKCREAAIYALGAMAVPFAREYLEYLATGSNKVYRNKAQVALKLFGKATYDDIKAKAEAK